MARHTGLEGLTRWRDEMGTPLEDATKEILEEMLEKGNPLIDENVERITKGIAGALSIYSNAGEKIIARAVKAWLFDYSSTPQYKTYRGIPIFEQSNGCCSSSQGPAVWGTYGSGGSPLKSCFTWE